ncbi:DUF423 domain-containing protein [Gallaecimonas mangrovi]|uniref:DUF423 domain-containing protein n=1 Tax=Gallaecimonas mangrovi TaxID=2291597 RepID=UPI000E1FFC5A
MRFILAVAAFYGATGVAMGAFAAHGLKKLVSAEMVEVVDTGVRYQMLHAITLIGLVLLATRINSPWLTTSAWLIAVGTLLFSGSLYFLGLTDIKFFGPVTPIGGVCLILGWLALMVTALKETL